MRIEEGARMSKEEKGVRKRKEEKGAKRRRRELRGESILPSRKEA